MNKFNVVEKISSVAMHISNCLDDPQNIVSILKSKVWEDDPDPVAVGPLCFLHNSEPGYREIDEAMMHAANIFLSSTDRDISDYKKTDDFYRIATWKEGKSLYPHLDGNPGYDDELPQISLVMYLTDNYEGGILKLTQFEKEIRPKAGDILVFNSRTYHEVSSHLGGERITTRLFLYNK